MYNRTIGERLKSERERLWLSLDEVSNATRINKKYLLAIEANEFGEFSSHTQAIGFIRNYSNYLGIDPSNLIAIYKRDFEAEKLQRKIRKVDDEELGSVKKPNKLDKLKQLNITSKRVWAGISILFIIIFVFLAVSVVKNAFAQPTFKITVPTTLNSNDNVEFSTSEKTIQIKGETQGYTLIKVNEIPLVLSSGFTFQTENLPTTDLETRFVITAESQLGVKSQATLVVKRIDIAKRLEKKEVKVSTIESGVFLKATVDSNIQYNDLTVKGIAVTLQANQNIEIETDKYTALIVELNGKQYLLSSNHVKLEINEDGNIIQTTL